MNPGKANKKTASTAASPAGPATPASPPPQAAFPIVGIGASAGGLAAFEAFFSAMPADCGSGHGLCAGAAPGPGPQKHPGRPDPTLYPHAGLRGGRRHGGAAELRLHHPAQPRHGVPERHAAVAGAHRATRPAPADRLFLPLPGAGPARAGHRHRALRHRQRRHPGRARHQGRSRHGHGADPRVHRVRRHAAQRHRHRPGGL